MLKYFADMEISMKTLFQITTGDDWARIVATVSDMEDYGPFLEVALYLYYVFTALLIASSILKVVPRFPYFLHNAVCRRHNHNK